MLVKTLVGIFAISLLTFSLLYLTPDNNPYSPYNYGPTGLSDLFKIVHNVSNSNTILILIYYPNLQQLSSINIIKYLKDGKTVIIAGNYSLLNDIFKQDDIQIVLGNILVTSGSHYYMDTNYLLVTYNNMTLLFPYSHPVIGGKPLISLDEQILVSCVKLFNGKLIVISSPYIFINKFIVTYNNEEFIKHLLGEDSTIIVVYHNTQFDYVKAFLSKL